MFDMQLYSKDLLRAKKSNGSSHFHNMAVLCQSAQVQVPGTFWVHHRFYPADYQRPGDCCPCDDGTILRFPSAPPPGLEAYLPLHKFQEVIRDVNLSLRPRDGCISKGCGLTTFILLFYFTIFGIFCYMCIEANSNKRGLRRAKENVAAVLTRHNARLADYGIRVVARYNPLLPEATETGLDASGEEEKSIPYLCFVYYGGGGSGGGVGGFGGQAAYYGAPAMVNPVHGVGFFPAPPSVLPYAPSSATAPPAIMVGQPKQLSDA
jgi:hypothetical protein